MNIADVAFLRSAKCLSQTFHSNVTTREKRLTQSTYPPNFKLNHGVVYAIPFQKRSLMQASPPAQYCPECGGSGCAQSLRSTDESLFLVPRCEVCKGKGKLSPQQYEAYQRDREQS